MVDRSRTSASTSLSRAALSRRSAFAGLAGRSHRAARRLRFARAQRQRVRLGERDTESSRRQVRDREGGQLVELAGVHRRRRQGQPPRASTRSRSRAGIKVKYNEDYNDNDEFFAKVRPLLEAGQDTGRDTWVSTDWMVARLIRLGYVQPLDYANIPNLTNLEPSLKDAPFDPGRVYSLPWQIGFVGIAYNPKATGGRKVTSVDQLLHDPALKGKVTMLTEMRDTVGLVLIEQGKNLGSVTAEDFTAALAVIQAAKDAGQIKGFTGNEYTKPLASGDTAACVAWTGDVVQLRADNPRTRLLAGGEGHPDVLGQLRDPEPRAAQDERGEADQPLLRPGGDGRRHWTTSTTSRRSRGAKAIL